MKKTLALLLALILCALCIPCSASAEQGRVMTSFYPIYILALNVFDSVEDIVLDCMTAPETGCLHDYQLLVSDMIKLSDADALIVCGAGMETYLPDVQTQFPDLQIMDCSAGIALLHDEEHHHHGDEDEEDEEEAYNPHTWLDVQNAIQIVRTIAESASTLYPEKSEQLRENASAYILRLEALDAELKIKLEPVQGKQIVTFHEAFPYFAKAYGLEIAAVISEEHEETLSPAELAQVIEKVKQADNPPLFTEPQYSDAAAYAVAAETGAAIHTLDPLASGEIAPDAYEKGMRANADALLAAFGVQ